MLCDVTYVNAYSIGYSCWLTWTLSLFFAQGRCASCGEDNSRCAYFGIRADEYTHKSRVNVPFFYDTDKTEPFCCE